MATREELRRLLGGIVVASSGGGRVVRLRLASGAEVVGVTVAEDETNVDVCVASERIVRVSANDVHTAEVGELESVMQRILEDARELAHIEQGMHVEYALAKGQWRAGVVVERCRWGVLVDDRIDGRVLAVSFRRVRRPAR